MPRSNWARESQLLSLCVWSLCSATGEDATVRGPRAAMKSGPRSPQLEKALAQKRRPNTAKKIKNKIKRPLSPYWDVLAFWFPGGQDPEVGALDRAPQTPPLSLHLFPHPYTPIQRPLLFPPLLCPSYLFSMVVRSCPAISLSQQGPVSFFQLSALLLLVVQLVSWPSLH